MRGRIEIGVANHSAVCKGGHLVGGLYAVAHNRAWTRHRLRQPGVDSSWLALEPGIEHAHCISLQIIDRLDGLRIQVLERKSVHPVDDAAAALIHRTVSPSPARVVHPARARLGDVERLYCRYDFLTLTDIRKMLLPSVLSWGQGACGGNRRKLLPLPSECCRSFQHSSPGGPCAQPHQVPTTEPRAANLFIFFPVVLIMRGEHLASFY